MNESQIFGVSIRGWLAVMMILTMCAMGFLGLEVKEPLKSSISFALGFYFAQSKKG